MMRPLLFTLLVAYVACDFDINELSQEIRTQVAAEADMSMSYLDMTLRFQKAMSWAQAGNSYFQLAITSMQVQPQGSFEEEAEDDQDAENSRGLEEEEEDDDDQYLLLLETSNQMTVQQRTQLALLATYNLFSGVKTFYYQTLYQAHIVQQAYWTNRLRQLFVQSLGNAATAEQLQRLYLESYATQIETLKLAYQLQTIALFSTWLEDEIDVLAVLASPPFRGELTDNQNEELIADKMFAFNAYGTYALLDMQSVYLQLYLSSGQGANANSFLEVDSSEQAKFVPGQQFDMAHYFVMLRIYQAFIQLSGAQAGQGAAYSEKLAFDKSRDNDPTNDADIPGHHRFARQSWGSFGQMIAYASQIELMTTSFQLYTFYSALFSQTK